MNKIHVKWGFGNAPLKENHRTKTEEATPAAPRCLWPGRRSSALEAGEQEPRPKLIVEAVNKNAIAISVLHLSDNALCYKFNFVGLPKPLFNVGLRIIMCSLSMDSHQIKGISLF
jgi:hypothetical protein